MNKRYAPVAITVLALASLLVSCAESPSEPAESPVATQTTTAPSEEATAEPTPDEPEPAESSEPEPSGDPTPTAEATDDPAADGDPDEVDGVRTNTFLQLSETIGDMTRVSSQSDPSVHGVVLVYEAADHGSGMQVKAQFANVGGEYTPLSGADDEIFDDVLERAESLFAYEEARTFSVEEGEYDWQCIEATRARGGDEDHSLCLTVAYGRVIDVEYLTQHDEDAAAREDNLSALLGEISDGLVALG